MSLVASGSGNFRIDGNPFSGQEGARSVRELIPAMTITPSALMQSLISLSVIAGKEIMAIYATDFSAKA